MLALNLRRTLVFTLLTALLVIAAQAVEAQDAAPTEEGSVSQLNIGFEPTLGIQLMTSGNAPVYFSKSAFGGGSIFVDAGGNCVTGYTTTVPVLGMVWVADSGPVDIRFAAAEDDAKVAGYFYELSSSQWYCNSVYAPNNAVQMNNLAKGVYFVWFLTEEPGAVSGELSVEAQQAETPSEPTAMPTRGR